MKGKPITNDTVITIGKSISMGRFLDFFKEATSTNLPYGEHNIWLAAQVGKTVGESVESYVETSKVKPIAQKLSEERFNIISNPDKAFIVAFDKWLESLGYDYGGGIGDGYGWGKYMIIYGKTGVKSRPCPARIYIKDDGKIQLRFFLKNIDKHRKYIENAPSYVKDGFAFDWGDCKNCVSTCKTMKIYTIDDRLYNKCCHSTVYFSDPTVEKLPDLMALYSEFNPVKKAK